MGEYRTVKVQDAKLLSKAIDLPQKLKILEKNQTGQSWCEAYSTPVLQAQN